LQQLHWRVSNDVFANAALCARDNKDNLRKVNTWKDRLELVESEAMPSVSQPGDLGLTPGGAAPRPADKPHQMAGG